MLKQSLDKRPMSWVEDMAMVYELGHAYHCS
jgi:hypothetical protein